MPASQELTIRPLEPGDWAAIVVLDEVLTGTGKGDYWQQVFARSTREEGCIGLVARAAGVHR